MFNSLQTSGLLSQSSTITVTNILLCVSFFILQAVSQPLAVQAQETLYVDATASGVNDGSSWDDAYIHLQDAIDEANINASSDFEILIAEGTYFPDEDNVAQIDGITGPAEGDHFSDDRSESFIIARDNIILQGGYPAGGGERNPADNRTVLSGDITQDDTIDENNITQIVADQAGENSYHVVSIGENILEIPGSGGELSNATRLDGVTITAGMADGSSTDDQTGGGLVNSQSDPVLIKVIFSGNLASARGGAVFSSGNPVFVNSTFAGNQAGADGGTIAGSGGAMYNSGNFGESSPVVINTVFSGNESTGSAGAIYNSAVNSGVSSPMIVNSTFSENTASGQFDCGGAIVNNSNSGGTSEPVITNTILWGNSSVGEGDEICNIAGGTQPEISYSILQGGTAGVSESDGSSTTEGNGVIDQDPMFTSTTGADGTPGTSDDDLTLQQGSPAINSGDAASLPSDTYDIDGDGNTSEPLPIDRAGNERSLGSSVDMGSYEAGADGVTLPVVTTNQATNISESEATLNGTVNPGGASTTVTFEYYPTLTPGESETEVAEQSPISGTTEQQVSATLTGLNSATEYTFILRAENSAGSSSGSELTFTTDQATSIGPGGDQLPQQFRLEQNYPNPFNPTTTIRYGLPQESEVTLKVYNSMGREVATLVQNTSRSAGWHNATFDASNLSSGIYIYRLQTEEQTLSDKLTLIK